MSYIIWIVVGAVLVIMAIIGYIAEHRNIKKIDKTDVSIPEVNVQKIEGGFNDMGLSTSPSDLSATNLNETNSSFSQSQPVEMATDSSNPQVDSLSKETAQSLDTSTSQLNTPTPEPIPASKQPVEPTVMPALEREVKPTLIQENMTDASDPLAYETAQSLDTSTPQLNTPTPEPIPASKQPVEPTVMPALEREVKPTLIQENMTDASDPLAYETAVSQEPLDMVNNNITGDSVISSESLVSNGENGSIIPDKGMEHVQTTEPSSAETIWS